MSLLLGTGGVNAGGAGGGGATITLTNTTASKSAVGEPVSTYHVKNAGTIYSNTTLFENWISVPADAGDYEVRATLSSGTSPTGSALGSWLALTADRSWSITAPLGGSDSCVLVVDIRDVATSTIQDTATITIQAISLS